MAGLRFSLNDLKYGDFLGEANVVPKAKFLFEVSFEVANKIGGIYAVIKSKIPQMMKYYGDNYITIGYYDSTKAKYEFLEEGAGAFKKVFKSLEKKGIKCRYGRWHTEGMPRCILIDVTSFRCNANDIKTELWTDYQIDSIRSDDWFSEPIIWGRAAGMLIEELAANCGMKDSSAHFHEWMSGAGLLYLKKKKSPVATVFMTHATMLGRTIASFDEGAQEEFSKGVASGKNVDPKKAYEYCVEDKHLAEKACAANADVFTTVSEATALEAEYILAKAPDLVLQNGLETDRFPSMEELSYLHTKHKAKIISFLRGYFGAYYDLNIDDPRILYLSGRYEFRNKGIDIFLKSLGQLNNELKKGNTKKDVFAFIFVPADSDGENMDVLRNVSLYHSINNYITEILPDIRERMLTSLDKLASGKSSIGLISDGEQAELKRSYLEFRSKKGASAPLCAFDLKYDQSKDSVVRALMEEGLLNREEDRVKVIFYPKYLSNSDRLLGMSYKSMSIGCSAGIFPSFYEPWGYTPLEAAAYGSMTVTTDYAGYGQFIEKSSKTTKEQGIFVLKRRGKKDSEVVGALTSIIRKIIFDDKNDIIHRKNNAKALASLADWKILAKQYILAHNRAIDNLRKTK